MTPAFSTDPLTEARLSMSGRASCWNHRSKKSPSTGSARAEVWDLAGLASPSAAAYQGNFQYDPLRHDANNEGVPKEKVPAPSGSLAMLLVIHLASSSVKTLASWASRSVSRA